MHNKTWQKRVLVQDAKKFRYRKYEFTMPMTKFHAFAFYHHPALIPRNISAIKPWFRPVAIRQLTSPDDKWTQQEQQQQQQQQRYMKEYSQQDRHGYLWAYSETDTITDSQWVVGKAGELFRSIVRRPVIVSQLVKALGVSVYIHYMLLHSLTRKSQHSPRHLSGDTETTHNCSVYICVNGSREDQSSADRSTRTPETSNHHPRTSM